MINTPRLAPRIAASPAPRLAFAFSPFAFFACFASFACFAGIFCSSAPAQVRSSASYSISSESFTSGLLQGTSANYKLDSSTDVPATGIATAGVYTNRQGHIAQLTEPVSLVAAAASDPVNEQTNNQLSGAVTNDDTTTTNLAGSDIMWSIVSGPISSIGLNGLASTAAVYTDTNATAEGNHNGVSDQVTFTVTNINPDNYLSYGGDGLEDGWQVGFFGLPPNANAGPGQDPDGDGQDNAFEILSGFSPIDSGEFFQIDPLGFSAVTTLDININKVIAGTKYAIFRSPNLQDPWTGIGVITPGGTVLDLLFQDPAASSGQNYYRAVLEKN